MNEDKKFKPGEIWFAYFPYTQDPTQGKHRPVLILRANGSEILATEITSHAPRDSFDIPIQKWQQSGLNKESTVRSSKGMLLPESQFVHKIGRLNIEEMIEVQNTYFRYIRKRQFEQSLSDPEKSYLFQKTKHDHITTDTDIKIAKILLKQNHKPKIIINTIIKHSPNLPKFSNQITPYAIKIINIAERQLKAEKARTFHR